MHNVVIKRCPYCPSIGGHAAGMAKDLEAELHVPTRVEDGAKDELSVWVDGVPVVRRTADGLPSVAEVRAAVRGASPVGV